MTKPKPRSQPNPARGCRHPEAARVPFTQTIAFDVIGILEHVAWCSECGAHQIAENIRGKLTPARMKLRSKKPSPPKLTWRLPRSARKGAAGGRR